MRKLILLFACVLWCVPATFAQEITLRTRVETLFKSFAPGEIESSIDTFTRNSLIPTPSVDELKAQTRLFLKPENKILGYEFLGEQNTGQSIKRLTYILKTSERPLMWTFTFYKPESEWVLWRMILSEAF